MSRDDESNNESFDRELGEVSAEEAAEAAELTRALAGKGSHLVSDEALEGTALLRVFHEGELSPTAFARIEADVLGTRGVPDQLPSRVAWRKAWWWLLAAVAPAAAALLIVVGQSFAPESSAVSVRSLPVPDVSVLEAQASWVGSDENRPAFEREMRDYRAQVLASLDVR